MATIGRGVIKIQNIQCRKNNIKNTTKPQTNTFSKYCKEYIYYTRSIQQTVGKKLLKNFLNVRNSLTK
jgi:hypothetical protein